MQENKKYGMVAFEEEGMPWTKVCGKFELIEKVQDEAFGSEEHWKIRLHDGEFTFVPISSVAEIPTSLD